MKITKFKKAVGVVLSVSMVAAMASGCASSTDSSAASGNSEKKKDITLSCMIYQSENKQGITDMFNKIKKEKGITIDEQIVPDEQYNSILQTKVASDEVPDIIENNVPQIYPLIDPEKYLYDFSNEDWVKNLNSPEVTAYKGKQYALPFVEIAGFYGAIYNKKVFKDNNIEIPKTPEEFDKVCETLKSKNIAPVLLSSDLWVPQIWTAIGYSRAMGSDDASKDMSDKVLSGKAKLNDYPQLASVIDDLLRMKQKGYINDDMASITNDDLWNELASGKGAMTLGENNFIGNHKKDFPDTEFGIFNVPVSYDKNDTMVTAMFSPGLVASKNSKNIDAVKEVFSSLSTPDYLNLYFTEGEAGFPPFKGVDGGDIGAESLKLYDSYKERNATLIDMNTYWTELNPILSDYLWTYYNEALVKNDMNGKQLLDKFQKDVDKFEKEAGKAGF